MNQIAIRHGNGFALEPSNLKEAMDMAKMLSDSAMVPACYKGKAADTLVAMMMGNEVGLNPIQALQNIAVINGRPSIYGDALLALVQNHPAFGGIEESFDESTMTATCTVWRKNGSKHTQAFSQKDAVTAKLWGKAGPWTQYPKRMLQMRARGFAVRSQFADALAGLITREEAEDMPVEREVTAQHIPVVPPTPAEPIMYPEADFAANLPKWRILIESGRKTPDQIIATVESKGLLSESQKDAVRNLMPIAAEAEYVDTTVEEFFNETA